MHVIKYLISFAFTMLLSVQLAHAHAFPVKNIPGAGSELEKAPTKIVIHFDDALEPVFSKLIVKDSEGNQVSLGNGQVDEKHPKILSTKVNSLSDGDYHVYWKVVSRDGHTTEGDYTFTINSQAQS